MFRFQSQIQASLSHKVIKRHKSQFFKFVIKCHRKWLNSITCHNACMTKYFFISDGLITSLAPLEKLIPRLYPFKNKDRVFEISTQVFQYVIKVSLQRNLAQKIEM